MAATAYKSLTTAMPAAHEGRKTAADDRAHRDEGGTTLHEHHAQDTRAREEEQECKTAACAEDVADHADNHAEDDRHRHRGDVPVPDVQSRQGKGVLALQVRGER